MLRVFEAFAGIGTQRMALRNLGIPHEVVAIAEIDKFAIKSYEAIHGPVNNLGDISKINPDTIPDHDLFTYSFPCQDISVAGKQAGLDIDSGTRSGLLWECQKVIVAKKPKYLLMENVKNLVGKKHKPNFDKWLDWLESQGYTNDWQVLNAKDYGVPQNRECVFCVSILGEHKPYIFPEKQELTIRLKDILEDDVDEKYYLTTNKANELLATIVRENDVSERVVVDSTIKKPKIKNVMNAVIGRYDAGIRNQQSVGGAVIELIE
ncbi:DNA (cytosine-5-)-methyltransferase [Streptococcus equi subsp. equi]|uniref:DNA (cytosine-5-)-methyltransferase n=1 Tax=Streptococcus equi TaxID=1336 RepID=UPI00294B4242|nr:DNA (cytosine-5-)-methyltransferase [Streptococcus equi]WOK52001.1 DNA (cytosine-5-)-methyltransferase [Streptococcus equi subsp. equi]